MRRALGVFHRRGRSIYIENRFFGDSMDGQVTGHLQLALAGSLHLLRFESDRGILRDIKEVVAPQIIVASLHPAIDRAGVDGYIDRCFARVTRIGDRAADLGERSSHIRDAHVANRKLSCRVCWVQVPCFVLSHGAEAGEVSHAEQD